jgi:hypothetical protein
LRLQSCEILQVQPCEVVSNCSFAWAHETVPRSSRRQRRARRQSRCVKPNELNQRHRQEMATNTPVDAKNETDNKWTINTMRTTTRKTPFSSELTGARRLGLSCCRLHRRFFPCRQHRLSAKRQRRPRHCRRNESGSGARHRKTTVVQSVRSRKPIENLRQ